MAARFSGGGTVPSRRLLIALGCLTTLVSEVANFIIVGPSLVGFVSAFVADVNQLCTQTPVEQLVWYLGLLMAAVGLVWHALTSR